MPRHLEEETKRVNCHLFTRDVERIKMFCQRGTDGERIPFNQALRMIVHTMLNSIEAKAALTAKPMDLDNTELELED